MEGAERIAFERGKKQEKGGDVEALEGVRAREKVLLLVAGLRG